MKITRTVLSLIIAAGMCAPALAQPKDRPTTPTTPTSTPATATTPTTAQPKKDAAPANMQLPPGVTAEDMQACTDSAQTGPMHEWMSKCAGTYQGKVKIWMSPEAPAAESTCTTTITPIMGGRFLKVESKGDFMGMPFEGNGFYGYDNVSKKFQSVWFDNCGTGMITGTGSLSSDGHVLTLNQKFNCPIHKKEVAMREVQTYNADGSMTLEMFGPDKTGNEFRTMQISYPAPTKTDTHTPTTTATPGKTPDMKAKPDSTVAP